jgi:hypothetical protein
MTLAMTLGDDRAAIGRSIGVEIDQFFDISSINKQVAGASSRSFAAVRSYSVVSELICRSGKQIGHGVWSRLDNLAITRSFTSAWKQRVMKNPTNVHCG